MLKSEAYSTTPSTVPAVGTPLPSSTKPVPAMATMVSSGLRAKMKVGEPSSAVPPGPVWKNCAELRLAGAGS